jgi:hypothetical protein
MIWRYGAMIFIGSLIEAPEYVVFKCGTGSTSSSHDNVYWK